MFQQVVESSTCRYYIFKSRGETLKVHSIRYSNFSISPQITNRYSASLCIKLISTLLLNFMLSSFIRLISKASRLGRNSSQLTSMTSVNEVTDIILHWHWTWITDVILNNYRSALNDPVYWNVLRNSKAQQNCSFHLDLIWQSFI